LDILWRSLLDIIWITEGYLYWISGGYFRIERIYFGDLSWRCDWISLGFLSRIIWITENKIEGYHSGISFLEILWIYKGILGYLFEISFSGYGAKGYPGSPKSSVDMFSYPLISHHIPRHP
jgi:hypothetical protein